VFAVCLVVLGSREDAEDAVQEAFASLAGALRGTVPREFCAWLARVARNAAIDVMRRRRARTSLDEAAFEVAAPLRGGCEEIESVLAGIRELPESQRSALVMRELAGYSYQEIGVVLAVEEAHEDVDRRARGGPRQPGADPERWLARGIAAAPQRHRPGAGRRSRDKPDRAAASVGPRGPAVRPPADAQRIRSGRRPLLRNRLGSRPARPRLLQRAGHPGRPLPRPGRAPAEPEQLGRAQSAPRPRRRGASRSTHAGSGAG